MRDFSTLSVEVRFKKLLSLIAAFAVVLSVVSWQTAQPANAANKALFNASHIITDAEFYNGNGMTVEQVQSLLNREVPNCTIGTPGQMPGDPYKTTTVASQCLKDFKVNTTSKDSNANCAAYVGQSNESAANIIVKVGQACGINPKVILVTLQKEQSFITDSWPTVYMYDRAMGYGCPDNGPNRSANCDEKYFGFFNQVYNAAWQFKNYRNYPMGYPAGQTVTIQYNTEPACGAAPVFIQNHATAALYAYTPYQPNPAALRGYDDGCRANGNLNFWSYYTDWFGSTGVPPVTASLYATTTSGALMYYPGNGHNGWAASQQVGTGWNTLTSVVNAGDLNGDGSKDIVAMDAAGNIQMYATDGGYGWAGQQVVASGFSPQTSIVAPGDFNGDGNRDLMTVDSSGNLWFLAGRGNASFEQPAQIGIGWQGFNTVFGVGDWNSDGTADLIARNSSGDLILYPGDGTGSWAYSKVAKVGNGWQGFNWVTSIGDYDGKGVYDVVGRTANGSLQVYTSSGASGWLNSYQIGQGWGGFNRIVGTGFSSNSVQNANPEPSSSGPTGSSSISSTSAGNGIAGLYATAPSGDLWYYPGNGSDGWGQAKQVGSYWQSFTSVVNAGDINGDNKQDIVTLDGAGSLRMYATDGGYSWTTSKLMQTGWNLQTMLIAPGDFNGDGKRDLITRDPNGYLWLLVGDGNAGFSSPINIGSGWQSFNTIFGVGDFNGDQKTDLMARTPSGDLWLYPGNGSGSFAYDSIRRIGTGWQGFNSVNSIGDFNSDGVDDIVGRLPSGELYLYRGNGSAGWISSSQIGSGWQVMNVIISK